MLFDVLTVLRRCRASVCRGIATYLFVALALATNSSRAVDLPLGGYFKPGRYLPVRVDAGVAYRFIGDGVVPTSVAAGDRAVVPVLVTNAPRQLKWDTGSLDLRPVGPHERLVASIDASPNEADLFPDETSIPVRLDAFDPLPGPAASWEALDAVVLNNPALRRLTDSQRSTLLAAGVMLAGTDEEKPDDAWPWQKVNRFWVLKFAPAGPVALIDVDAYSPTFAWTPTWSSSQRQLFAAVGLLYFVAVVGLSLYRGRHAWAGVVGLSLLTTAGLAVWQGLQNTSYQAGGDVFVYDGTLLQRDAWLYQRGRRSGSQTVPWSGLTRPVFGSEAAMLDSGFTLQVDAERKTSFAFGVTAHKTMAFVRRQVQPGGPPEVSPAKSPRSSLPSSSRTSSPMRDIARDSYLSAGDAIAGETAATNDRWPGVVVRRK